MLREGRARRVLLAAGGTGGHFYPGYVLGRALRDLGFEALFLVREEDPAGKVLAADGLPFVELPLRGLPRRPSLELLRFAWRLGRSLGLVHRVVADFQPDAVVGMGGYLSFPAAWAAWRRKIPVLLHESNSVLGLANRVSLPFARLLALGLPPARPPRMPFLLSGTPVRPELWKLPDVAAARRALALDPDAPVILVFGGSQGARSLNQLVPEALRLAAARGAGFQVIHLPGAKEADAVRKAYEGAPFKAVVLDYLHEMDRGYAAADLVVCRAGASTLAELAATSRPALLIPFPFAAANHQEANASAAARAGAARCLPERDLSAASLAEALTDLIPSAAVKAAEPRVGAAEPRVGAAEPRVGAAEPRVGAAAARARLLEMGRCWSRLGTPSAPDCVAGLVQAVRELAERP